MIVSEYIFLTFNKNKIKKFGKLEILIDLYLIFTYHTEEDLKIKNLATVFFSLYKSIKAIIIKFDYKLNLKTKKRISIWKNR